MAIHCSPMKMLLDLNYVCDRHLVACELPSQFPVFLSVRCGKMEALPHDFSGTYRALLFLVRLCTVLSSCLKSQMKHAAPVPFGMNGEISTMNKSMQCPFVFLSFSLFRCAMSMFCVIDIEAIQIDRADTKTTTY
uniref:Uncharacterized protein n=1 Tax=Triticum urartu TaxID=4572 RepID=A0A8R7VG16_TRIUA